MCRHRFGVLNNLYNELISEGITDVHIMGVNGYQYVNDSYDCMICNDECTSSTCDNGIRPLPWTQDYDNGFNCQGDNMGLCFADDSDSDIWDMWDITLRDLIILDRDGRFVTRINLTANNIDPAGLGTCSGNYESLKTLILSLRNM